MPASDYPSCWPSGLRRSRRWLAGSPVIAVVLAGMAMPLAAQDRSLNTSEGAGVHAQTPALTGPGYAELVALAELAPVALVVVIKNLARVPAERAPGLEPGQARLYLEANTESLLAGPAAIGGSVRFLADRQLDAKGRAPKLKGQRFVLLARTVPGRPGELQLVSPGAMLPADPVLVERARVVLRQLADGQTAAGGPLPQVTGVREAISIPGNLAGESETQLFLQTQGGEPASLTVLRRPGLAPEWGVSWTEIVDPAARAPKPETLPWYRLACFLPTTLPDSAFLQEEADARARARADYAFIREQLGPCSANS